MAFVSLETYKGEKVNLNPDAVQGVTTHNFYDWDKELPGELMFTNNNGLSEVRADKKEEADAARTSERTLVLLTNGSSYEVKGSVAEVLKSLAGK